MVNEKLKSRISPLFFLLIFISSLPSAVLQGKVVDKTTQHPLPGVNIVVLETNLGASTDETGLFFIDKISPGSYNIGIYYLGYKSILKSNVIVNPNRTVEMYLEMESDILEGNAVEVFASYFEKSKESVVSTRTVDFEEIRRDPGSALDIQRVMQALPAVVSGTDQNNEIIVRGGIPGENLFLMDNIEIPNPNHFGDQGAGGGPINMLNTYMVKKVDFYAGAFSAKYGDKASSVMDISLREGSRNRLGGHISIGMAGAGFLIEGPITGLNGSFIFSARKSFLDLIIKSTGLTAVPRYHNLQTKLTFDLNSSNRLFINGIFGSDKINIEDEGGGGYSKGAENVDYSGRQYAFGLVLQTFWSKNLFSNTILSTVGNNWEIDAYRKPNKETYFFNNSKEFEHTIKSDFVFQINRHVQLNWGGALKSIAFNHHIWSEPDTIFWYLPNTDQPFDIYRTYPGWTVYQKKSSHKTALYTQLSLDFLKRLRFTFGLRNDYFTYNSFNALSPRMGFSYFIGYQSTLNFAYGLHYQSPSYLELTAHPNNQNLQNKYTRQYVLSLEHILREDIKITVETYYKSYHNVPILKSLTTADPFDQFQGERINRGKGNAKGIELFFQKKLTKNFSTTISYAHSISKAKDLRYNTYYNWDFDFRNVFTLISGYKFKLSQKIWYQKIRKKFWYHLFAFILPLADEVEISLRGRFLGGRPYTPPIYHPEFHQWLIEEQQQLNYVRYPIYNRFDFRLDRRFFFKNWNMVVYLDMMNVFNRHNIWEYQYNSDGSVEKILQFEVFPVGGLEIEF